MRILYFNRRVKIENCGCCKENQIQVTEKSSLQLGMLKQTSEPKVEQNCSDLSIPQAPNFGKKSS